MAARPTHPSPPEAPPAAAEAAGAAGYRAALQRCGGVELRALSRGPAGAGGGAAGLCAALYTSPAYDLVVPALALPRLSITLTPSPLQGALEGDTARRWHTPRHALFLTPAGAAARWHKESASRHINLYFSDGLLQDECSAHGRGLGATPLLNQRLPGLGPLADALAAELSGPDRWAEEAVDSLGRLILVRLARHHTSRRPLGHALPAPLLARVHEFARAHLAQRILVADLARVAGLSPNHFAHAYSRTTGRSPHQAVLAWRVDHALMLLRQTSLPLSEVALAAGFASQQHLSRVLRQRQGLTPAQARRDSGRGRGPRGDPAV